MKAAIHSLFHKEYETIHALSDISFEIGDGEIVGYIGPNGAGKSSTIKIMSGILMPTSGSCEINGMIPWKNRTEYVRGIGVVFGQRSQLWWDVPVGDSFLLLKDIYRIPEDRYRKNLSGLSELLDLGGLLRVPARQLSLGQRMRCELGASLLHTPGILFLDEPTIGLDAVSKLAVREMVRKINREYKTTVILTTHDMQDIESLTDRILFIGKGRILTDGSMKELKKRYAKTRRIELRYEKTPETEPVQCPKGLFVRTCSGQQLTAEIDTEQLSMSEAIRFLSGRGELRDIQIEAIDAEEIVAALYREYRV